MRPRLHCFFILCFQEIEAHEAALVSRTAERRRELGFAVRSLSN